MEGTIIESNADFHKSAPKPNAERQVRGKYIYF